MILLSDLKLYAAAVHPEDDVVDDIGGDIDLTKKHDFADFADSYQVVSSNVGDTTQSIELTYRDAAGSIQTEIKALNGQTVVTSATAVERVMKAEKDATCAGDVALESSTAVRTNTMVGQGGNADQVILDAGASAVDGAYTTMVLRLTGGTGDKKIAEIINYDGATKVATLSRAVVVDATTTFRISKGVFFDKSPSEIMSVVRLGYDLEADIPGGSDFDYYMKMFAKHTDASASGLTLTSVEVKEGADPTATVTFGLDAALNDNYSNGGGNTRLDAPAGIVFDNADKAVPGDELAPADYIGIWVKITLVDGAASYKSTWTPRLQGQTV